MKVIEASFEILPEIGIEKDIERAARICYKSENLITENSAQSMVERLIKNKHTAMLEHGTVYLTIKLPTDCSDDSDSIKLLEAVIFFKENCYSKVVKDKNIYYITTNLRVIKESYSGIDLTDYIVFPSKKHKLRRSVKFICSRAIAQQLTRHRKFSMAMESQRFCNYSKDKFEHCISFIRPQFVNELTYDLWYKTCVMSENAYFNLLEMGRSPQEARAVLLNCTKTEIIMTGYDEDWEYFFKLRASNEFGKPDPEILALTIPLKSKFDETVK